MTLPHRKTQFTSLAPFIWSALACLLLGLAANIFLPSGRVLVFCVAFVLAVGNLMLLAKVGIALLNKERVGGWAFLKFACLGAIGLLIVLAHHQGLFAILTGLAAFIVIPMLGGLWWSLSVVK